MFVSSDCVCDFVCLFLYILIYIKAIYINLKECKKVTPERCTPFSSRMLWDSFCKMTKCFVCCLLWLPDQFFTVTLYFMGPEIHNLAFSINIFWVAVKKALTYKNTFILHWHIDKWQQKSHCYLKKMLSFFKKNYVQNHCWKFRPPDA